MAEGESINRRGIGIGLLGLGVVGGGVAQVLTEKSGVLTSQAGSPLAIRRVLVRDPRKPRSFKVSPNLVTTSVPEVLGDPKIDIVIEVLGGESPAYQLIRDALSRGKHVVTANKEVMGKHGPELSGLAQEHRVALLYEASAGGGIPLVGTLSDDLSADNILAVKAIINGTTNYILTRMANDGLDFAEAQALAQELGYAEPDPTDDIEGIDAAHKLAILATLAFRTEVRTGDVYREGISRLVARDFQYARELGYAIKLLAIAKDRDGSIEVRVHPTLLPEDLLLAKVDGVFNAAQIDADVAGRVLLYGRGAGPLPTASAIISDVVKIARGILSGQLDCRVAPLDKSKKIQAIDDIETQYYIRMMVEDTYGVLAQITQIFGERHISLASVIQKRSDEKTQTAEIVLMTHPALERAMQAAISEMETLSSVKEIGNVVRVEG
ncbi:MAG: homoserine dehydrogenase [Dehalococcoidia bacterium]